MPLLRRTSYTLKAASTTRNWNPATKSTRSSATRCIPTSQSTKTTSLITSAASASAWTPMSTPSSTTPPSQFPHPHASKTPRAYKHSKTDNLASWSALTSTTQAAPSAIQSPTVSTVPSATLTKSHQSFLNWSISQATIWIHHLPKTTELKGSIHMFQTFLVVKAG